MQHFRLIYIVALIRISTQKQCKTKMSDSNAYRCIATDKLSDVKDKDCHLFKHCCLSQTGGCYANPLDSPMKVEPDRDEDDLINEVLGMVKTAKLEERILTPRSFVLPYGGGEPYPGFSKLPPFVCQSRPSFPKNCILGDPKATRYVRNPPTNIPYCLRIPCDPTKPQLDIRPSKCRAMPGCYFDKILSDHRNLLGHSAMPGVPVCQLAIRNAVFQHEAKKVIHETGSWNPYLTECLLETFDSVIRSPKDGCKHLATLEYFQYKPKLAGWKNIKEYDCVLLDACWVEGMGCFYPVDPEKLSVTLTTIYEEQPSSALYYGRPKCQYFDERTPEDALNSYHSCLLSGCKVDKHAQKSYYNYLYSYGMSMKMSDHWIFWRKVESGNYGAHNFRDYKPKQNEDLTITPFSLVIPMGSAPEKPSLFAELISPISDSLMDLLQTNTGVEMPPSLSSGTTNFLNNLPHIQAPCSSSFTTFGGRPCGPPKYQASAVPPHCPFRSIINKDLRPLKGSFEGCCDINLCYVPKAEVREARSGTAVYFSEWSYWTECTVTCGEGTKQRWRKCIGLDRMQCGGPLMEKSSCIPHECGSWGEWGNWGQCAVTCRGGIVSRERKCKPVRGTCPGPREEVKECNTGPCKVTEETYGPWSSWMGICEPCGKTVYRRRSCRVKSCDEKNLQQTRRCPTRCGNWQAWSDFGPCEYDFLFEICHTTRTRKCLNGRDMPAKCPGTAFDYKQCTDC